MRRAKKTNGAALPVEAPAPTPKPAGTAFAPELQRLAALFPRGAIMAALTPGRLMRVAAEEIESLRELVTAAESQCRMIPALLSKLREMTPAPAPPEPAAGG